MRILNFYLLLLLSTTLMSCSSKLSESKIQSILSENFTKEDLTTLYPLEIGEISYMSDKDLTKYQKLAQEGLINIESSNITQSISLTDKASEYVSETYNKPKGIFSGGKRYFAKVRIYSYKIEGVEDIHENPSDNTATARITFKKTEQTPFIILDEDKTEFIKKKLKFYKTTDNEWKLLRNDL